MFTHFICFANSRKYGERCVAGIEVSLNGEKGLNFVRKDGKPKWIRPVTIREHGQIDERLVKNISLLDLVKVKIAGAMNETYQVENVLVDKYSFEKIRHLPLTEKHLDALCSDDATLFGNTLNHITKKESASIHHSLMLIKVQQLDVLITSTPLKTGIKANFIYNRAKYELPVTDVCFCDRLMANRDFYKSANAFYLTVSLGVLYEEKHFKLAAGVIAR